jgi:hypothetical protein
VKKTKQGKMMESDESCCIKKGGRESHPDKMILEQGPGEKGCGAEETSHKAPGE